MDWQKDLKRELSVNKRIENKTEEEILNEWLTLAKKYKSGDIVKGKVFIRAPFGVFLDINESFPALLEIIAMEELDYQMYLQNKCFKLGEEVEARFAGMLDKPGQIRLSQK